MYNYYCCWRFETVSRSVVPASLEATCVAQATLEAVSIFLPWPPQCQDCKCKSPFLSYFLFTFYFIFVLCMWPGLFFLHVCLCTTCMPVHYVYDWCPWSQKRASDALDLKLQTAMSHHLDAGDWIPGPLKCSQCFYCCTNHQAISLASIFIFMCLCEGMCIMSQLHVGVRRGLKSPGAGVTGSMCHSTRVLGT